MKQLLDNIGGRPEGYIPINAGHPSLHVAYSEVRVTEISEQLNRVD